MKSASQFSPNAWEKMDGNSFPILAALNDPGATN
jgi:hypothetical protein